MRTEVQSRCCGNHLFKLLFGKHVRLLRSAENNPGGSSLLLSLQSGALCLVRCEAEADAKLHHCCTTAVIIHFPVFVYSSLENNRKS
jgi:hypothetical protein